MKCKIADKIPSKIWTHYKYRPQYIISARTGVLVSIKKIDDKYFYNNELGSANLNGTDTRFPK